MPEKIRNISVLMPAYNCGNYIAASIKSILNQTFSSFELIIVDDGSTDNTEQIIKGFNDARINYRKTENKGTSAALNYGLTLCNFDWVARIDADDLNIPSRLETQVNFLNNNQGYDVVSAWSVYFKDPGKILFVLKEPTLHEDIYDYLDLHNPLNQSALIYRKDLIADEGYDESFTSSEDFELFHRIRSKARFCNIPRVLAYTRVRSGSRSDVQRTNLYEMLFPPAFKKLMDSKSKGDHFYWASTIAWINYFYGDPKESRSYFRNSFSVKNLTAYFTTFLPDEYFHKFINSRLRYRIGNMFAPKSKYKNELKSLLK
ncbi:MAG: glycosyltransferase [Ignavibacteria bacterium]|nr:glycosyltransferase [Ignavibacteria bacterium]